MNDAQQILDDAVSSLFSEQLDRAAQTRIEATGFDRALWEMSVDTGLTQVLVGEEHGGMGGRWIDAFIVARACGHYAVPLPIPETLLACWLQTEAGLAPREGVAGLITTPIRAADTNVNTISLSASRIPWGRVADYCVGVTDVGDLLIIDAKGAKCREETNLALEPRDELTFANAAILARGKLKQPVDSLRWYAALLRSSQIGGAAAACLGLSVKYTSEREQFGRALSQFQAIQQQLADLASHMASIDSIVSNACIAIDERGLDGDGRNARFNVASAKCRASDAVEIITRISHQVHGAIGFTYEYNLHFLTRRLWAWRAEYGTSGEWGEVLGRIAITQGGDKLWEYVTA